MTATVISECSDGYDAVKAHYTSLYQYLNTGSGTPPDPTTAITGLSYDNLLTFATQSIDISAGHSTGAAVEVVAEFYSLARELDMANFGKVQLIATAATEAQEDADLHDQNSSFFAGVLSGQPTSGTRS